MRIAVLGTGAVGTRAARQLHASEEVDEVVVWGRQPQRVAQVVDSLGERALAAPPDAADVQADVAVIATGGNHRPTAEMLLRRGMAVVSTSAGLDDVLSLLDLDAEARERRLPVVVGAAFAPGLTCLLAARAAADLTDVAEIHVAQAGTGGPACARQHHRALGAPGLEWRRGWERRPPGSGGQVSWFPDPLGGLECYHAALPASVLLEQAFPAASRISTRIAANRRDRLTARFPMLRPPHPEGLFGGVRVEVRGMRGGESSERVLGAVDRPAVAAAAVAAVAALWVGTGRAEPVGSAGLATWPSAGEVLLELARRGVKAAVFAGSAA